MNHMTRHNRAAYGILDALLALLVGGVGGCFDGRSFTTIDSWYNPPPPKELAPRLWTDLPPENVRIVLPEREEAAETMLSETAAREVTPETAAELTGRPSQTPGGLRCVLVRGVYLNRRLGSFWVRIDNRNRLWVGHGSMGAFPVPMKRQAIVVQMSEMPTAVFVSCDMTQ
jgi:hypothetical protein